MRSTLTQILRESITAIYKIVNTSNKILTVCTTQSLTLSRIVKRWPWTLHDTWSFMYNQEYNGVQRDFFWLIQLLYSELSYFSGRDPRSTRTSDDITKSFFPTIARQGPQRARRRRYGNGRSSSSYSYRMSNGVRLNLHNRSLSK